VCGVQGDARGAGSRWEVTAREVLLKAAAIIVDRGWQSRLMGVETGGPYCLLGAFCVVGGGHAARWMEQTDRARDALRTHLRCDDLTRWNDTPGRTAAEVIAALRGAAEGAAS
jgi:hypothetical protein